jgi:hypothetical protein
MGATLSWISRLHILSATITLGQLLSLFPLPCACCVLRGPLNIYRASMRPAELFPRFLELTRELRNLVYEFAMYFLPTRCHIVPSQELSELVVYPHTASAPAHISALMLCYSISTSPSKSYLCGDTPNVTAKLTTLRHQARVRGDSGRSSPYPHVDAGTGTRSYCGSPGPSSQPHAIVITTTGLTTETNTIPYKMSTLV